MISFGVREWVNKPMLGSNVGVLDVIFLLFCRVSQCRIGYLTTNPPQLAEYE